MDSERASGKIPRKMVNRGYSENLYSQLYDIMKGKITSGEWPEGALLPAEREFCSAYGISRITVRAACSLLEKEGLLERRQGKGTFVKSPEKMCPEQMVRREIFEAVLFKVHNSLAVIGEKAGLLADFLEDEQGLVHGDEYPDIAKKITLQVERIRAVTHALSDLPGKIETYKIKRSTQDMGMRNAEKISKEDNR